MATTDLGLFGLTPEDYQQAQLEKARANAIEMAKLDPMQRAEAGLRTAGYQLGGGIAGLMGVEDPRLKQISEMQGLLKGIDPTDPTSYFNAAKMSSNPQLAAMLVQRGQDLQKNIADRAKTQAETLKIVGETTKQNQDILATSGAVQTLISQFKMDKDQALAIAKNPNLLESYLTPITKKAFEISKTGKYTPESVSKYLESGQFSDLVELDKMSKPTTDWLGAARSLNIDAKAKYGDYTPEEATRINQFLLNKDVAKNAAMRPPAQETAFARTRGELQAKALDAASTNAQGARAQLVSLNNLEKLSNTGQLYSGPLAMTAVGAANFLNSVGLLGKEQVRTLANSEIYDKSAKDLVMNELNGRLGAQISDSDRKFIEARIPQLTNSPLARAELIQKLKEIQTGKMNAYQTMNAHANQYGQLNTFDFSQNYMPLQAASSNFAKPQLSSVDQQALEWANANPRDPRAAQIKQKLGVQ